MEEVIREKEQKIQSLRAGESDVAKKKGNEWGEEELKEWRVWCISGKGLERRSLRARPIVFLGLKRKKGNKS